MAFYVPTDTQTSVHCWRSVSACGRQNKVKLNKRGSERGARGPLRSVCFETDGSNEERQGEI